MTEKEAEETFDKIIIEVASRIYGIIMHLAGKYADTFVINPAIKKETVLETISEDTNGNQSFADINEAYEALDISPGATQEEIRKAYKEAARKNHPGKGGSDAAFQKVKESYDLLLKLQSKAHKGNILTLSKKNGTIYCRDQKETRWRNKSKNIW